MTKHNPQPRTEFCDRIINNGFGEPTECGRTYPCEYHDQAATPEAGEAVTLVMALARHYLTDGSPCFCSSWDAVYENGDVEHQPRCRMGRMALGYSGEPRTSGCAAGKGCTHVLATPPPATLAEILSTPLTAGGPALYDLWSTSEYSFESPREVAEAIIARLGSSPKAALDGRNFGRVFGEVMKQHPDADARLVNDILHTVASLLRSNEEATEAELDVETRLWQYADHKADCLAWGPAHDQLPDEHPERCNCGFQNLADEADRLAAIPQADEAVQLRGHGGLVDSIRQHTAGMGADLAIIEAWTSEQNVADAAWRLRRHLRATDDLLTAALATPPPAVTPEAVLDVEAFIEADHLWCVEVEGEWALAHGPEAHRKKALYMIARLRSSSGDEEA